MSYRIYIEGRQLFGNNDCPQKWIEFIKSQDIEVSDDNTYSGIIKDFMACLNVVEDIVLDIYKDYSLNEDLSFDLSSLIDDENSLLYSLQNLVSNNYLFLPYQLYELCKDKIEVKFIMDEKQDKIKRIYKIKDGETITTAAY